MALELDSLVILEQEEGGEPFPCPQLALNVGVASSCGGSLTTSIPSARHGHHDLMPLSLQEAHVKMQKSLNGMT